MSVWKFPAPRSNLLENNRPTIAPILRELVDEINRQDAKHGPYEGTRLGRSRLALATLEDEVAEALAAWRAERGGEFVETRIEVLQVAAVAIRCIRDTVGPS